MYKGLICATCLSFGGRLSKTVESTFRPMAYIDRRMGYYQASRKSVRWAVCSSFVKPRSCATIPLASDIEKQARSSTQKLETKMEVGYRKRETKFWVGYAQKPRFWESSASIEQTTIAVASNNVGRQTSEKESEAFTPYTTTTSVCLPDNYCLKKLCT